MYITGTPAFAPGSNTYTLSYATAPAVNRVAVTGSATTPAGNYSSNFTLANTLADLKLAVSGNNLVIAAVE